VQDLFLTENRGLCRCGAAGLRLAGEGRTVTNTNRQVQMGRQALPLPGNTRHDLWIIQEIANRMGCGWNYKHVSEVFTEMASMMPALDNITWERVEREHAVTYPTDAPDKPGRDVVFDKGFPRPGGFAKAGGDQTAAAGRGSRRGISVHSHHRARARTLAHRRHDAPRHGARRHRAERSRFGVARHYRKARHQAGRHDPRRHRRGTVELYSRQDDGIPDGVVFIPFAFVEAAAKPPDQPALDPFGKIPEFKFCAARVEAVDPATRVAAEVISPPGQGKARCMLRPMLTSASTAAAARPDRAPEAQIDQLWREA